MVRETWQYSYTFRRFLSFYKKPLVFSLPCRWRSFRAIVKCGKVEEQYVQQVQAIGFDPYFKATSKADVAMEQGSANTMDTVQVEGAAKAESPFSLTQDSLKPAALPFHSSLDGKLK